MSSGSITPTTFESREFTEDNSDLWFIDQFVYNNNNVVRFGINNLSSNTISALTEERICISNTTTGAESTTKSSTKYTKADAALIQLCNLENVLLNKACSYLLNNEATRAVLVDIFVRVNGGPSNGDIQSTDNIPEIHTVVLYRNPSDTIEECLESKYTEPTSSTAYGITVIDPSNFIFSSHLSNFVPSVTDPSDNLLPFTISTIHKTLQIYQPATKDTGPNFNQYRDCIDVAVKIALGLNNTSDPIKLLTYEDIKTCHIIQNLSNISGIDTNIINTKPQLTIRIKQTSDTKIVDLFNKLEHLISNELEIISKLDPRVGPLDNKNEVIKVLSDEGLNSWGTISGLYQCNIQCNAVIANLTAYIMDELKHRDTEIVSIMGNFEIGG